MKKLTFMKLVNILDKNGLAYCDFGKITNKNGAKGEYFKLVLNNNYFDFTDLKKPFAERLQDFAKDTSQFNNVSFGKSQAQYAPELIKPIIILWKKAI